MSRSKNPFHRIPSPAMAVAIVALVAACVGSATALPGKKNVDRNDLRRNVVNASSIADGSVGAAELAGAAVTGQKLADGSVTTPKLTGDAVTTAKIAGEAVTTAKVANGSITEAKLADDARSPVVAFARVDNATGSAPAFASPATGFGGVTQLLADGEGATRLTLDLGLAPGNDVSNCAISTSSPTTGNPNSTLGVGSSVLVATGGTLTSRQIQVQTRTYTGDLIDRDYEIVVACPRG